MYILLNGAFGIGKTTVARALKRRLPGSAIVDPERLGFILQRIPGRTIPDYQDLPMWRRLTIRWARAVGRLRSTVIVPMAFTNIEYLREIRSGLAQGGGQVLHFCLTAPLPVVHERLSRRGEAPDDPRSAWAYRRAEECCAEHSRPDFATQVPTAGLSPESVADAIASQVGQVAA